MPAREKWKCPKCGRRFAHARQWHSCQVVSLDHHFAKAPLSLIKAYEKLSSVLARFGPYDAVPTKTGITLLAYKAFAGVRVGRDVLRIEFLLSHIVKNPRILRTKLLSGQSIAYLVEVKTAKEIDSELRGWLQEAYQIGATSGRR